MARWIALFLLLVVIFLGVKNKPTEIEQGLHARLVYMLAGEDLSEVRVEMDGRNVLLSGPRQLVPQAVELIQKQSGISNIIAEITNESSLDFPSIDVLQNKPVQILQSNYAYWPAKSNQPASLSAELLVTKVHRSIEVNGAVSNHQMKQAIHSKITQLIEIPEYLYDVSIENVAATPNWYTEDLPLILPFVRWVEEGQILYQGDRIQLEGIVLDEQASRAIETAIANIPAQFQIENRLQIGTN